MLIEAGAQTSCLRGRQAPLPVIQEKQKARCLLSPSAGSPRHYMKTPLQAPFFVILSEVERSLPKILLRSKRFLDYARNDRVLI